MRKESLRIIALSFVLFLFLIPLLRSGFYESHDGENHVARFGAYYKAFSDLQISPRWAGDLNYEFGSPLFNFFYPLPGYIGSLFHALGFTLEDSFKLVMGISFILAPLGYYLWASTIFPSLPAFLAALFFGLAPYHLLDLYVRGDVGEMLAFVFMPLVFLMIEKTIKRPSLNYLILGGIFYALLILSHNILSLMFTPVFLAYIFLRSELKQKLIFPFLALFLGLLLSAYFWLPALYEAKYINSELFVTDLFKEHFPSPSKLVFSSWGFGADVNKVGGFSPQVGVGHITLVFLSLALINRFKKERRLVLFWLAVFLFAIFMTVGYSSFLWSKFSLLAQFQFPWKFTALSSFAASVLAGFVAMLMRDKRIVLLFILILIATSFPFAKVKGYLTRGDEYYFSFQGTTYYHGEATTIWTAGDPGRPPEAPVEVITGKAEIGNLSKKSNRHLFTVVAETDTTILDNTIYFPGWRVFVNGVKVPIEFQDINHRGVITFRVPQGTYIVEVMFGESPIRLVSDIISLVTLFTIVLIWVIRQRIENWYQYYRVL